MEEFEKSRKQVLGRVLAGDRRKYGANLTRGAMDGRNKDEQQERLRDRFEPPLRARSNQFHNHFIDRRILIIVLAVKVRDESGSGRKWGQDFARSRPEAVFFQTFFMIEFIEEARLETTDEAIAVASGHHDDAPASVRGKETDVSSNLRTWFG